MRAVCLCMPLMALSLLACDLGHKSQGSGTGGVADTTSSSSMGGSTGSGGSGGSSSSGGTAGAAGSAGAPSSGTTTSSSTSSSSETVPTIPCGSSQVSTKGLSFCAHFDEYLVGPNLYPAVIIGEGKAISDPSTAVPGCISSNKSSGTSDIQVGCDFGVISGTPDLYFAPAAYTNNSGALAGYTPLADAIPYPNGWIKLSMTVYCNGQEVASLALVESTPPHDPPTAPFDHYTPGSPATMQLILHLSQISSISAAGGCE